MPTPSPLHQSIARRLRRWRDRLGPRWVVAVSGGGDSVALLMILHGADLGLDLSVAHLDHGVRGEAAREDARFVADLADRLGLPFDLGWWSPDRPGHFEADARRARYGWLAGVAARRGASAVAVGHSRDDQAETILHRILRGTGPRGLAGMPRARTLAEGVTLVRPLLVASRERLRAYLTDLGQPWREDASNQDPARARARVRHDLLPRLAREANPAVADALVRLGALTRAAVSALEERVGELARSASVPGPVEALTLDRARLAAVSPHLRAEVLRHAWRSAGWPEASMDARRWGRLARWAGGSQSGRRDVGAGVRVDLGAGLVTLDRPLPADPGPVPGPVPLPIPGAVDWPGGRVVASVDDPGPGAPGVERLDFDRLVPPLVVDRPRPGDRFDPLGLGGRTRPLADFLRGRHVLKDERASTPIVRDALGIVWVAGHRIGHRARLTGGTTRALVLILET